MIMNILSQRHKLSALVKISEVTLLSEISLTFLSLTLYIVRLKCIPDLILFTFIIS